MDEFNSLMAWLLIIVEIGLIIIAPILHPIGGTIFSAIMIITIYAGKKGIDNIDNKK